MTPLHRASQSGGNDAVAWHPGWLWSLWDMLHRYAWDLVTLTQLVTQLTEAIDEDHRTGSGAGLSWIEGHTKFALEITDDVPLPSVRAQLKRIIDLFSEVPIPTGTLYDWVRELKNRLEDDAGALKFVLLRSDLSQYYTEPHPFGESVSEGFPSAIDDISDAGKCLALGQGTATVFHLMRIMEAGLKALARPLGIPYAPSWESYLKQINNQINADHKSKDTAWKNDEALYRDLAGDLQIVKITWRNPTMHIVKKYTSEEAEEIFRAVRSFMKRLVARWKE